MKKSILKLIALYQRTLSPDHGWLSARHPYGYCRFAPTCSEYAADAIENYGSLKGAWLALGRLARCHPFGPPSHDPLIRKNQKTSP